MNKSLIIFLFCRLQKKKKLKHLKVLQRIFTFISGIFAGKSVSCNIKIRIYLMLYFGGLKLSKNCKMAENK
jgi:hypothetical protein